MNGLIIYKGKYGATRQYADWLGAALDYPTSEAGYERPDQFTSAAPLIIGTSIYIGKFQVRKWLKQHQAQLLNKKMYLFVVSGTPPEKKKNWKTITKRTCRKGSAAIASAISCRASWNSANYPGQTNYY